MNRTPIQWTNWSANPLKLELPDGSRVNACVRVSPGCQNCYAEMSTRRWWRKAWKTDERIGAFPGYKLPLLKLGKPVLVREELDEVIALDRRIPAGKADPNENKVFWNDVTDAYLDFWPDEFRDEIEAVRAVTKHLIHQDLTKRAEQMAQYLLEPKAKFRIHFKAKAIDPNHGSTPWPPPHIWRMVSIDDQPRADERIPWLLKCPAATRGLSIEPLLGDVDVDRNIGGTRWIGGQRGCGGTHKGDGSPGCPREPHHHHDERCSPGIDWAILGVESIGARVGRFADGYPAAAKKLIDQLRRADVATFHKQYPINGRVSGDPDEWPEWARVRQFPTSAPKAA